MPGQRRDFTAEHRAAVARLRAETGKSHAEIAELAFTQGIDGLSYPRRPSVSTVQDWCNRVVTVDQIRDRLLVSLDAQITAELPKLHGEKAVSFIRQSLGALGVIDRPRTAPRDKTLPPKNTENGEGNGRLRSPSMERFEKIGTEASDLEQCLPIGETEAVGQPAVAPEDSSDSASDDSRGGPGTSEVNGGEASHARSSSSVS